MSLGMCGRVDKTYTVQDTLQRRSVDEGGRITIYFEVIKNALETINSIFRSTFLDLFTRQCVHARMPGLWTPPLGITSIGSKYPCRQETARNVVGERLYFSSILRLGLCPVGLEQYRNDLLRRSPCGFVGLEDNLRLLNRRRQCSRPAAPRQARRRKRCCGALP